MTATLAPQTSPLTGLISRLQALLTPPNAAPSVSTDNPVLMQASVAAAVHVIVADGEAAEAEFAVAADGLQACADRERTFEHDELLGMLHAAAGRARTRSGRIENLRYVSALADRSMAERQAVFLLAADVADVEGTSGIEERALAEIAAALDVNRTSLSDQRAGLGAIPA